jgi:hypothetical protein
MMQDEATGQLSFAEMLRTWTPPSPAELSRLEEKRATLHAAEATAYLALVPAGLAVLAPLFGDTGWSKFLVDACWGTALAILAFAIDSFRQAKRINVRS